MSHRGEALHKDVCCIADLKDLGSRRLSPMVRGKQSGTLLDTLILIPADYYNEGAMDLITYCVLPFSRSCI